MKIFESSEADLKIEKPEGQLVQSFNSKQFKTKLCSDVQFKMWNLWSFSPTTQVFSIQQTMPIVQEIQSFCSGMQIKKHSKLHQV